MLSDFYFNNYYFFWTQFFLLPSLLFYLFITYNIFLHKYKNLFQYLLYILLVSLLVWWIYEYYILNSYLYFIVNIPYSFNNLLYNSLNKYHPIIFFTSYIYIYKTPFYTNYYTNSRCISNYKFFYKTSIKKIYNKNNIYWVVSCIALYLGAWWALQEGSWGGWWNWDSSEVFGLVVLTFILFIIHFYSIYSNLIYQNYILFNWILILLFFYTILQMSYTLVSHNFGLNILDYGYVNTNFLLFTILIIMLYLFIHYVLYASVVNINYLSPQLLISNMITVNQIHSPTFISLRHTYIYFISLMVIYIYSVSFNPIINNILWTSFNIELLNKCFLWVNPQLILLVIVYLYFFRISSLYLYFFIFTICNTCIYIWPIFIYHLVKKYKITLIHLLVVLFCILPILLNYSVYILWDYYNQSIYNYAGYKVRSYYSSNILVDNLYIVNTAFNLWDFNIKQIINSFFWLNSNPNIQYFLLDTSDSILTQGIYNHTYLYTFKVVILDIVPIVIDSIFTYISFILLIIFNKKNCIIS